MTQLYLLAFYILFLVFGILYFFDYSFMKNIFNNIYNKWINLFFLVISIIYIYYCIDIIGCNSIDYNFNLSNNLSNLYYFSDSKLKLASALLLLIIIPNLKYIFVLILCLIYINYEIIILIILGLYSIYISRKIFLSDDCSIESNNVELNIVDNLIIRSISTVIICLFILVFLTIINLQYNMLFSNIFIIASHGFFICINNIIKSLYYQYKETNSLQICNYRYNNYFSKASVILMIIIRFIYTYLFFHHLYTFCIIIILFIVCLYMVYKDELDRELTHKSKSILLICFILYCIIRIMIMHIQYVHNTSFDMIKWFDNDNRGDNSNNEGRANLNPRRLPDLPELYIPPRNNTPLIPSITSMRSNWDQISGTRNIRNGLIIDQGLNHNNNVANSSMHLNRVNIPTSFGTSTLHSFNTNRIWNPSQPILPGNRNIIHLPLPPGNTQALPSINTQSQSVFNSGRILTGNNIELVLGYGVQTPTYNIGQLATNGRPDLFLWAKPLTSGPLGDANVPYPEDIEYARTHNLPVPQNRGIFIVRFSNSFINSDSLLQGSNTPPTPSSPIEKDWMDIREVPEERIDELVPEIERVPSPVRRFSKFEIWDKLHDHPLKDSYPLSDETYLPHDRLPISTRLDVYNGFVIYDRINEDFSFSGLDRDKWFDRFIVRNGEEVTRR